MKSSNASTTPPTFWVLAGLSLSMLMPSLDTSIANAGLPALARALGGSFQAVQWVVIAYLLAVTTLIVSVGRLGDLFGRRRLLLTGIALFTVASIGCGAAPTLPLLIAARAAQGLGAAMMTALTLAVASDVVSPSRTGRTLGLLGTMSAIGTTLGPSVGGVLTVGFGWRTIFLVNVPLGILNWILAFRFLPDDGTVPAKTRARFDRLGTIVLTLTLTAFALAMTTGTSQFAWFNLLLVLAAIFGGVGFFLIETKTESPLVQLAMFRDPRLGTSFVASGLVATVMMTTLVVGPFYLSRTLGLSATGVGFLLSVGPLMAALTGVPAGRLVDRMSAPVITILGLGGIASGSIALAVLPAKFGVTGYLAPLVVVTAGYALFQTANNTAIMTNIRAEQRGVVSGLLNLSRNLGLITGASLMGAVFAAASATSAPSAAGADAVAFGMRATFAVAALLIMVAIGLVVCGRTVSQRRTSLIPVAE